MDTTIDIAPTTALAARRWTGRVLSGIPALFLAFDAIAKLANVRQVAEGSLHLGMPVELAQPLGVVLAICLALYLVPRTAVLGAVLLTGYLGGAVAMHVRIGDPLATHALFPVYVGILLWAGLYVRDVRVQALVR
jgi:hypothetical protein